MRKLLIVFLSLLFFVPGCGLAGASEDKIQTEKKALKPAPAENVVIKMATTTSTDNSGLLGYLLPVFKKETGIQVDIIAVGTGKAIKLGENGDVDLILVHARKAEDAFVQSGFGINRKDVMYNDFVVLGPSADAAGVRGMKRGADGFAKISATQSVFVSRGDDSGTHKKEKEIWEAAGVTPEGEWYRSAGQGMGAVLMIADEKQAYTLADRGTFIAYGDKVDLEVLCEGDKELSNPYGIIAVNPKKHKHVKYDAAMKFIEWMISAKAQSLINGFKIKGQQLFYGNAE